MKTRFNLDWEIVFSKLSNFRKFILEESKDEMSSGMMLGLTLIESSEASGCFKPVFGLNWYSMMINDEKI